MYLDHTTPLDPLFSVPLDPRSTINILTSTIRSLTVHLSSGTITSAHLVSTYLAQIDTHDPRLRALIAVAPREGLMRLARERDEERYQGKLRGALHGIPIVVKDNIETHPELGMPTSAGSYALLALPVKADAFVIRKLREAGAIIIGKANLSELASYKTLSAIGWSAVGGQTINPYCASASPGSSSAGNGVAVAAGMCAASVGTDTDGSIVLPCFKAALYGLKPTRGVLSRTGLVPFAESFDSPGPMGRSPGCLAVLLDVMAAEDAEDAATIGIERLSHGVKYVESTLDPSFKGLRIGIPHRYLQNWHNRSPASATIGSAFERAIEKMAEAGATVVDPADVPSAVDGSVWQCAKGARSVVVCADFKEHMGRYLAQRVGDGEGCRDVEDLIAFNEAHADAELPPSHPDQDVLKWTRRAVPVDSPAYRAAQEEMRRVAGENGLEAVFDRERVDALFSLAQAGEHSVPNMVGYPMGAVPLGLLEDGTPFGAIFIGRKFGERTLLRAMSAWEATFGPRPLPPMAMEESLPMEPELSGDSARKAVPVVAF